MMEIYGYPIFRQCQVTLDQEVKVLYPQKSCSFDVTRASDKLMKAHCRDDPSIFGTRRVEDGLTLGASESFGSFGIEVADFLQKEFGAGTEKEDGRGTWKECRCFLYYWFPYFFLHHGTVLGGPAGTIDFQLTGNACPGSLTKKLTYQCSIGCYVLGGLAATIAIGKFIWLDSGGPLWQLALPAVAFLLSGVKLLFIRRVFEDLWSCYSTTGPPIGPSCSKAKFFQAPANVFAHGQASTSLLGTPWSQAAAVATSAQRWSFSQRVQSISAATTLSPKGKRSALWGAEAVGLPLVDKVDSKHRKCTQGRRWNGGVFLKKRHFLRSQAFSDACDGGIEGLSKEPFGDSSSQYSREVQRLFLAWLPEEERHFMEASEGLGNSQKAEVTWLERKGYAYTEVEVDMLPVGDEKVIDFSPWDSSWFSRAVGQATCFWVWGDCAGSSPVSAKVSEQNESIRWLGDM